MKIVETATKDLEYNINLVDKAAARFERTDSNFERSFTVGETHLTALHATEKSFIKGSQSMWQTLLLSYFEKFPQPHQPSATTTLSVSSINTEARDSTS